MGPRHSRFSNLEGRDEVRPQAFGESGLWNVPAFMLQLEGDGCAEMVCEVVSLFRDDTLSTLHRLREAVDQRDATQVRRQAHSLKGSSTQLGLDRMAALCEELEQRSLAGDFPAFTPLLDRLSTEFDRVWPAMAARLRAPKEHVGFLG